ncbi:MAG: hypothetical protein ACRD82_10545, partial [Blastocatellia bacterium]
MPSNGCPGFVDGLLADEITKAVCAFSAHYSVEFSNPDVFCRSLTDRRHREKILSSPRAVDSPSNSLIILSFYDPGC